ncbi:MAG TPA: 16S rRNA (guanine(527)-N(7))-methyltransferase RsmG [Tepidisphaeraceae bacterium]|jgi:16S rRNA (guanine527-N7)-methyltransferase|nr:16S rRNA (guanine(527)-N(7))-methyltransferase RsmG [Tepidisphaeraceae bacterium]
MNPLWQQLASRASVTLSQEQLDRFDQYLTLLLAANDRMNLTRIDTLAEAEVGHVGDTLTLLPFLPPSAFTLADVGSGGGVPGIPLAISRPDARITLFESTQKKAVFLEETARQLGLTNVKVSSNRAEVEAREQARDSFDIVTARALAAMNILTEWCLPLVKVGGKLLAMKGGKVNDELPLAKRAIQTLGGADPIVYPANLPGSDFHVIVEIKKLRPTDKRYPRPTAQIKEKPL